MKRYCLTLYLRNDAAPVAEYIEHHKEGRGGRFTRAFATRA